MNAPSYAEIPTPVGTLTVIADGETVLAAGFTDVETQWARYIRFARFAPGDEPSAPVHRDDLGSISDALVEYFAGRVDALDTIKVNQPGTELQAEVWSGLRSIPAGQTRTYTELAAMTSNTAAIRAAGTACGRNLVAPIVPCHRALRTDGSLGGYYYGLDVKRWLLAHEADNQTT